MFGIDIGVDLGTANVLVYVKKKGMWYDAKMFIYTFICIFYAIIGKECTWILNELKASAEEYKDK